VIAAAMAFFLAPNGNAFAYTLQTLHSFCTEKKCADGEYPRTGVLMDRSGNLYGASETGGKYHSSGVVFELVPHAGQYEEIVLHDFCSLPKCADGQLPESDLIMDGDGNLYGITANSGSHRAGVVFRIAHEAHGWSCSVIHAFCNDSKNDACSDGSTPFAGLAYAGQPAGAPWNETSPLFGTTWGGGAHGAGVAYELLRNGSGWTYRVIHSFNATADPGAIPSLLLVDGSGNIFGMTAHGGARNQGVLYRLDAGTWKQTTLHSFCARKKCADGKDGNGRLAIDGGGNIFGVTSEGGTGAACWDADGCGVLFERTAGGAYKVLHDFCPASGCKDGVEPRGGMVIDGSGNLFGTAFEGGTGAACRDADGCGVLYERTADGNYKVLYAFCQKSGCADGQNPMETLIRDASGGLFGQTSPVIRGNGRYGTVFELKP
jgi:uncharacterized repeat protein (TIGR03803 family)